MPASRRIQAAGWESLTTATDIGFPVPYGDELVGAAVGPHIWRMIQWVFALPRLELRTELSQLSPEDLEALNRFVLKASDLATSPYLAHNSSMNVSFGPDCEKIETDFPHRESTVGFLVTFRQFFDQGEPASYATVSRILRTEAEARGDSKSVATIDAWGRVHRKLNRRCPRTWVELKAHRIETDKVGGPAANLHQPRIKELVETYLYGDMVHYGDQKLSLAKIESDEYNTAAHEMTLHEGVAGLSMFYLGVADALRGRLTLV